MSTTSASNTSNASGSSQTGATKSASGNAQRADKSAQTSADLFASLLGLLGATFEGPPVSADGADTTALASTTSDDPAGLDRGEDPGPNPLASLLSWPGAPVLLNDLPAQGKGTGAGTGTALGDSFGTETAATAKPPAPASGTTASAAGTSGADSTELQGMTLLDQPVEADAELQASLETATQGAGQPRSTATNAARSDTSSFASRATSWRSTTALAHSAASAAASNTPTSTSQIQLGHMTQARMAADTGSPAARSTLTFDNRFSATSLGEDPSPSVAGLNALGHAGPQQGGADQQPAGSGVFAEALNAERSEPGADESDFELMPDNLAEELAPEDFALSPHQLRHASLRVGEGSEEAIDIQLALRGEQLNVDFRTDNADARVSLQQNASGTLSDLLQRGGIQLGQVSVGAQSQGQERQGHSQSGARSSSAATGRVGSSGANAREEARLPQAPLRRSDGSRPLDLFV